MLPLALSQVTAKCVVTSTLQELRATANSSATTNSVSSCACPPCGCVLPAHSSAVPLLLYMIPQAAGTLTLQGIQLSALGMTSTWSIDQSGSAIQSAQGSAPIIAPPWECTAMARKRQTAAAAAQSLKAVDTADSGICIQVGSSDEEYCRTSRHCMRFAGEALSWNASEA